MTLRIVIADDEPLARTRLRSLLEELGHQVCGEARDSESAYQLVASQSPDALFLDIEMPGIGGMELCGHLESAHPQVPVVLVTAHPEHALSAFDMSVRDYILKPVRKERIERALARLRPRTNTAPKLLIQMGRREELVSLDDIDCFVTEDGYVMARSSRFEGFVSLTLSEIENQLGPAVIRIHRNCVVVCSAVRAMVTRAKGIHELVFEDGLRGVTVSRRQLPQVKEFFRGRSSATASS